MTEAVGEGKKEGTEYIKTQNEKEEEDIAERDAVIDSSTLRLMVDQE
jgi:hypothetical protein